MDTLEKIKEMLGMVEVVSNTDPTPAELSEAKEHLKFEEATLEDGTIISADSFDVGNEVYIVIEDERQAMPIGEYAFADGTLLVVEELSEADSSSKDALVQTIGVLENLIQEFEKLKEDFASIKTEAKESKAKVAEFEKVGEGIKPNPEGKFSEAKSMTDFSSLSPQERVTYLINKNKNI